MWVDERDELIGGWVDTSYGLMRGWVDERDGLIGGWVDTSYGLMEEGGLMRGMG